MGSQGSIDQNLGDGGFPSADMMTETDEYLIKYIHDSIEKIKFSDNYFKNKGIELSSDFLAQMRIDPSYYFLLQSLTAEKNDFENLESLISSNSDQKTIFTEMNRLSGELIYGSRENTIRMEASAETELPGLLKEIKRKKEHLVSIREENKKLLNELEELKKRIAPF